MLDLKGPGGDIGFVRTERLGAAAACLFFFFFPPSEKKNKTKHALLCFGINLIPN